jgi:DNA-binding CsgD family transcriptional regulator
MGKSEHGAASGSAWSQRAALADFCRVWRRRMDGNVPAPAASPVQGSRSLPAMAPRLHQTLELLLAGDSEKQIAGKLRLSPHTVHGYVKSVYRRFNVCTRAELLALWVKK